MDQSTSSPAGGAGAPHPAGAHAGSPAGPNDHDREALRAFRDAVNMTAGEVERWLEAPESREVGWKAHDGDESVGHQSGRRIVDLLRARQGDYGPDDFAQMRRVTGYVHRHMAQRPDKSDDELAHTRWRYSLMNWGHDPLKQG